MVLSVRDEKIEQELEKLTKALKNELPSLVTVRVFGSYENGGWDPEKSDIDIFVLVRDERYSMNHRVRLPFYMNDESKLRRELRERICAELDRDYAQKFSVSICTPKDMKIVDGCDEGRGDIGKNMRKGRLLYGEEEKRFWEFWK